MAEFGRSYDPWQKFALRGTLGRTDSGEWSAFEACLVAPRQNGKNEVIEGVELTAIFKWGVKLVVHTAHELPTTEEAFQRMIQFIENTPALDERVKKINRSNGKESIEFTNGARIKYVARSKAKGRGWTKAELVIFDEAMMHLESSMMRALLPSMMIGENPQVWYLASGGLDESDQLRTLRRRALAGDDDLAYLEWSCTVPEDGSPPDVDDRDLWYEANPALGIRITERILAKLRTTLGPAGFGAECLCVWSDMSDGAVDPELWSRLRDEDSQAGAELAFGVAVAPGRESASIAVASWRPDGRMHVELVERWPGVAWVTYRGAELAKRWRAEVYLNPDERTAGMATARRKIGWKPVIVSGPDLAVGCKTFYDDCLAEQVAHIGQRELNAAVAGARRQRLDDEASTDVWQWAPVDSTVDIAPLQAATLAAIGLRGGVVSRRRRSGRSMAV